MLFRKEDILAKRSVLRIATVDVPEWEDGVHIREWTARTREAIEAEITTDRRDVRAKVAAASLCEPSGAAMFELGEFGDLAELSGAALDRIFDAAMRLNGMRPADVDDAEKN